VEPLTADDPREVGGFRLRARLGAGGMGRVYLGYSPGGRPVAVKVVHPELARDPEFMRRFRREVAAAQAVGDAYTAAVVGAGPEDSPPWMATSYVAGPSLAELVRQTGPLPEDAVWRLAGGLAEALQAIHAQGLVHRDLKPGNILISADGPRVIDFGISRATDATVLTATRMTMGTPGYMSPEQAEGNPVGPASDVFSLGSVLAFAAGGAAPFGAGEMFAVAYRVVHGDPDLSPVPAALRPLISICLSKEPAARPPLDQLMGDVAAHSAMYPPVAPGTFWPPPVAGAIESSASAPVPPLTPAPAPPATTPTAPGGPYPPTAAALAGRRRGPRWLLPAVLGTAVAAGAGIAIALVLSPSPTPPTFLSGSGNASSTAGPGSTGGTGAGSATVTVCARPAAGCGKAGAAQAMAARPRQIDVTANGAQVVTGLSWAGWGGGQATGQGTLQVSSCQPSCADGKRSAYPATVTLTGLTGYGDSGQEAYATITVRAPTAPTPASRTYAFTRGTVPS
jgi:Protein kinase domain